MIPLTRAWPRILIVAACVWVLDLWTKWFTLRNLGYGDSHPVLPFFYFTHVHNTGSAFGLFHNSNLALLVVSAVILTGMIVSAPRWYPESGRWAWVGMGLILGGAWGNIIDRMRFGYVIDFLDFRIWPVFNVADSGITIGTAILALGMYRYKA